MDLMRVKPVCHYNNISDVIVLNSAFLKRFTSYKPSFLMIVINLQVFEKILLIICCLTSIVIAGC